MVIVAFPELDEYGTPKKKLPNCPRCGDDELGVIHADYMMCYACGWEMRRCPQCGGTGIIEGDASAPAGSIRRETVPCPECQEI